jgi:hemerythrin superfamily protein
MAIWDVIRADHEKARAMLKELCGVPETDGERRKLLFADLKAELMVHQHVEEAVFYDRLKDIQATRPDALEAINEHHIVDTLLEELDDMAKDNDRWTAKLGVLRELVEHHMEEEEDEFFAHAKKVVDDDLSARMEAEFTKKKCAGIEAMTPLELD